MPDWEKIRKGSAAYTGARRSRKYSVPGGATLRTLKEHIKENETGPGKGILLDAEAVAELLEVEVEDLPKSLRNVGYGLRDEFAEVGIKTGFSGKTEDERGLLRLRLLEQE